MTVSRRIGVIRLPVNRFHIELTNQCNFSCEFCPDSRMKRPRGSMPPEMAEEIIRESAKEGIARMVLFHVMGEPLLYNGLVHLSALATRNGLDVCITTNGSLLSDEILNDLAMAGVREVIVSLQTPDEETFSMRGAKGLLFKDYADRISTAAKRFVHQPPGQMTLTISFLSSPLRKLIFPVAEEFSIADTSRDLRRYLMAWAERILPEDSLHRVTADIRRVRSYKENVIPLTPNLRFKTRILGDWTKHGRGRIKRAMFGYCPGLQENFGILYNGQYVFCCTDFDGRTSTGSFSEMRITEYLASEPVQKVVRGFRRFRVVHPYCQICLGDRSYLNTMVKQIGSVLYFKFFKGV